MHLEWWEQCQRRAQLLRSPRPTKSCQAAPSPPAPLIYERSEGIMAKGPLPRIPHPLLTLRTQWSLLWEVAAGAGVAHSTSWSVLGPAGGGAEGGAAEGGAAEGRAGSGMPSGLGLHPRLGLVAGGLLGDPQACGQCPRLPLPSGTRLWPDAPVAAETLSRCWAEGMRETWSLIWESPGSGPDVAGAVQVVGRVVGTVLGAGSTSRKTEQAVGAEVGVGPPPPSHHE